MHSDGGINYGKGEEEGSEEFMVCLVWVPNDAIKVCLFAARTVLPLLSL